MRKPMSGNSGTEYFECFLMIRSGGVQLILFQVSESPRIEIRNVTLIIGHSFRLIFTKLLRVSIAGIESYLF